MAISPSNETFIQVHESNPRYYGWRVVLAANLGVMGGFGSLFVYTFSVFLKPLSAQFGWSREAISQGFGIAAIMVAVCSPAIGRWLDRFGPRRGLFPGKRRAHDELKGKFVVATTSKPLIKPGRASPTPTVPGCRRTARGGWPRRALFSP
ncbi:MAG: MFS transporter [Terriglobia bacterium]